MNDKKTTKKLTVNYGIRKDEEGSEGGISLAKEKTELKETVEVPCKPSVPPATS